jgi:endonuclease YncB( thermonuclease family)
MGCCSSVCSSVSGGGVTGMDDVELGRSSINTVSMYSLSGIRTRCKMVSCYDGDTVTLNMIIGKELRQYKCRLLGIDCPEMKPGLNMPNRDMEKIDALNAKSYLISLLTDQLPIPSYLSRGATEVEMKNFNMMLDGIVKNNKKCMDVQCNEWDKYGRLLVSFPLENNKTVTDLMIENGHGYVYNGGAKNRIKYNN